MAGNKAKKQSMFNSFEIKGYWWLPGKEDGQVAGILFFEKEKIHLELLGSFSENDSFLLGNVHRHKVVLGFSDSGEEFTLFENSTLKSRASFPGYATESYSVGAFLVGGHFNNIDEITFNSVTFRPTHLTKWINHPVFEEKTTFETTTSKLSKNELHYNNPNIFEFYIASLDTNIKESYITNFNGDRTERVEWKFKSGINVEPNEFKNLKWFDEQMYSLKDLLTLFVGHAIYFEDIIFYGELDQDKTYDNIPKRKDYKYFYPQRTNKIKHNLENHDFIISYCEVREYFDKILNMWFDKQTQLDDFYDLFFSNFYKEIYINTSFLNTVQTLEIYHRKSYEGKLFDKTIYKEYSEQIKEFAKNTLPKEFYQRVTEIFAHGNELSLAKRLEEIFNSLDKQTQEILIGNDEEIKVFIRQLVDTRNYLTHYDSNKKKHLLTENSEKYLALQRLLALTTIVLFKEIGVDEQLILEKISINRKYSSVLSQAKNILN